MNHESADEHDILYIYIIILGLHKYNFFAVADTINQYQANLHQSDINELDRYVLS